MEQGEMKPYDWGTLQFEWTWSPFLQQAETSCSDKWSQCGRVFNLNSLYWPLGGDSCGCIEVYVSCVKADWQAVAALPRRGRVGLWVAKLKCLRLLGASKQLTSRWLRPLLINSWATRGVNSTCTSSQCIVLYSPNGSNSKDLNWVMDYQGHWLCPIWTIWWGRRLNVKKTHIWLKFNRECDHRKKVHFKRNKRLTDVLRIKQLELISRNVTHGPFTETPPITSLMATILIFS